MHESDCDDDNSKATNAKLNASHYVNKTSINADKNISGTTTFQSEIENSLVVSPLELTNLQFIGVDRVCVKENFQEKNTAQSNIDANVVAKFESTNNFQSKIENSLLVSKSGPTNVQFSGVNSIYANENIQVTNTAQYNIEANILVTKLGSTDKFQSKIENSVLASKSGSKNVQFTGVDNLYGHENLHGTNASQSHIEASTGIVATEFPSKSSTCSNVSKI